MDIKNCPNCPFCGSIPEEKFQKASGINEFPPRYYTYPKIECIAYSITITPENFDSWNSRKGLFLSKIELEDLFEQTRKGLLSDEQFKLLSNK